MQVIVDETAGMEFLSENLWWNEMARKPHRRSAYGGHD